MSKTASPKSATSAESNPNSSSFARSARETIESIAIAFALAFLFKAFEAEAFVIPTGSMAPTLMGRHKDVLCPECGYRYSASGSEEADREGSVRGEPFTVVQCTCPICRFQMSVDPLDPDNTGRDATPSYSGDRIWVSKVPYHFMEPRRWDVIVFRFPEEAETYYIKRLVGLPNETVRIYRGDLFTKGAGESDYVIQRKPPEKIRAMAQVVHDNDYISPDLNRVGWPQRWQVWRDQSGNPNTWQSADNARAFQTDGAGAAPMWIRYQHIVPSESDWYAIDDNRWSSGRPARPQLITDFYAFNTRVMRNEVATSAMLGLHWVGDLIAECQLDVQSPTGSVLFDLVKGGKHFRCTIDVATGEAVLTIDGQPEWRRKGATAVRGPGTHRAMFANVDQQLLLWIDDKLVTFDEPATYSGLNNDLPEANARDGGDLAPVGVGSQGAAVRVSHLRVLRDIYYIADKGGGFRNAISDFHGSGSRLPMLRVDDYAEFLATPEQWTSPSGRNIFDERQPQDFPLGEDEFFVLGDNSPASADARLWSQQFVERSLLVGKALFIYWPHPLNLYVPFTDVALPVLPDFSNMGFIR